MRRAGDFDFRMPHCSQIRIAILSYRTLFHHTSTLSTQAHLMPGCHATDIVQHGRCLTQRPLFDLQAITIIMADSSGFIPPCDRLIFPHALQKRLIQLQSHAADGVIQGACRTCLHVTTCITWSLMPLGDISWERVSTSDPAVSSS